ncbi:MAG: hypothetical protein ABJF11_10330 [Reichenbachiella sp.]|uniref:hypothetical protein n=1 Tax=Reichenbachiella sp. TaxID=2184521 RepID=UPI00326391CE
MNRIYLIISVARWLSLDVALGGVIFTLASGKVAELNLPWTVVAALGCCIWLIYTLDHLIDGNSLDRSPSIPRHNFHRKFRKPIFVLFSIVAGFGLWLLFYLPYLTLVYGCIMLGLVGLYFLSIWLFKIYFAKELFIAILYSCGIFLGIFSMKASIDFPIYVMFFQTMIMAFINLLLFSYFELENDVKDGHRSWVTYFGVSKTVIHLKALFALLIVSIISSLLYFKSVELIAMEAIFMGMGATLFMIFARQELFTDHERFRWIGDLVFSFPVLIYLL